MSYPDGSEFLPVPIKLNAPGKAETLLYHRHGGPGVCSACYIIQLRTARAQDQREGERLRAVEKAVRKIITTTYVVSFRKEDVDALRDALARAEGERK